MSRRVLITGHNGYIGSVMGKVISDAGWDVTGFDTGYFSECSLIPDNAQFPAIRKDIRDVVVDDLKGFDAIIHLAALSNDPIGNLNQIWTEEINERASVRLAELAKIAGVKRFLFSSSCIMYGMSEAAVVNENSPLDPKTTYARSKVLAEQAITKLADKNFSPTFLRNGTVYGLSPRMRFDTVLNDLTAMAVTRKKIVLNGDGKPWRPVIHVKDVCRAFLHVLEAPIEAVHNQAFNNGANYMNHQIRELADIVIQTVPGTTLQMLSNPSADQRTYKTDFGKFAKTFPDFQFKWTVKDGAKELYDAFMKIHLSESDYTNPKFTRLKWLNHMMSSGRLDSSLRMQSQVEASR